jgi:uncharacterized protein
MPEPTDGAGAAFPQAAPCVVCWIDLAAHDLPSARLFYEGLFGWRDEHCRHGGGSYTKLHSHGGAFGSMYQLSAERIRHGTPSHWLPYLRVADMDEAIRRAVQLGGEVLVAPFDAGPARIAVVLDSVGAQIGLWEHPGHPVPKP